MRLSLREEVMNQRKVHEMSELLLDVVFGTLDERDKLQSLLHEMESYLTQQTEISKSVCKVEMKDASVKTCSGMELQKEKEISNIVDELEDGLERRKQPLLDEVWKEECKVEMAADSAKTNSYVEIETEKDAEISKMIDELEAELESRQEPELDRKDEIFRTEGLFESLNMTKETDGVYCSLFGGSDDVDYKPIIIKNRQTETCDYHLYRDPLTELYNLFNCNSSKTVLEINHIIPKNSTEHGVDINNMNNFIRDKQDRTLNDKKKSPRRSFRKRLLAFFCCGKTNE